MSYFVLYLGASKKNVDSIYKGLILDENKDFIPNIFNRGESLNHPNFTIILDTRFSQFGKMRDRLCVEINSAVQLFVVSKRVQDFFEKRQIPGIEFYDLVIERDDIANSDYKLVNVTSQVNCLDPDESDIMYDDTDGTETDKIYSIDKLALHEKAIPDSIKLFMLSNCNKKYPVIIFREDLIAEMESEDLTGFDFCFPERFMNG